MNRWWRRDAATTALEDPRRKADAARSIAVKMINDGRASTVAKVGVSVCDGDRWIEG